ncbi:hypothetical protein, partial [uncultured Fretibacterium sp.]|uniref:hypothetical protein n=1 Tax=uncultured Fretibacterium sp. TaxID=1678694 RepID=UPI00262EE986
FYIFSFGKMCVLVLISASQDPAARYGARQIVDVTFQDIGASYSPPPSRGGGLGKPGTSL